MDRIQHLVDAPDGGGDWVQTGGQVKSFKKHPLRYRFWKIVTPLNAKHMNFAWASLVFVAGTDIYVRLVASGAITDYRLF